MSGAKTYQRNAALALAAMHGMSLQERGACTTLLEVWRVRDFSLPDDDRIISRILGVDMRVWKRLKASLKASGFLSIHDGLIDPAQTFECRAERRAIPLPIRRAVIERDGNMCRYCGDTSGPFELDHVLPWSRGGQDTVDNLVRACLPCNRAKRDGIPTEMGWTV